MTDPSDLTAVVPAAGEGTRLRPRTADTPKALVSVAGRPLLSYPLTAVRRAGLRTCTIVIGYRGEQIVDRFGDSYRGLRLRYVRQERRRGLGHAVLQAEPTVDGSVLVVNGDNVVVDGPTSLVTENTGDAAVVVERVSEAVARRTGVVATNDAGRVTGLVEKPADPVSTLVSAGCVLLPPETFHALALVGPSDRGEIELTDAIDLLVTAGYDVRTVTCDGPRVNVNTEADRERAAELVAESDRIDGGSSP